MATPKNKRVFARGLKTVGNVVLTIKYLIVYLKSDMYKYNCTESIDFIKFMILNTSGMVLNGSKDIARAKIAKLDGPDHIYFDISVDDILVPLQYDGDDPLEIAMHYRSKIYGACCAGNANRY